MIRTQKIKPHGYWTRTRLVAEARKYSSRAEFKTKCGSAYAISCRLGILDDICSHLRSIKPPRYWTKDRVIVEARKYSTRLEFQENCASAYNAAGKLRIRDLACKHMKNHLWTPEKIAKEVRRFNTLAEFEKGSPSAYGAASRLGIRDKITATLQRMRVPDAYWTLNQLIHEAKEFKNKSDFASGNATAYAAARRHKHWQKIIKHMPSRRPHPETKWPKHYILTCARRCQTEIEFWLKYRGAAQASQRKGWYKEATKHMSQVRQTRVRRPQMRRPKLHTPPGTWTRDLVLKEARKHSRRTDFQTKGRAAYMAARRLKIMDEACKHMRRVGTRYKRAIYAFEFPDKSVYVGLTYDYNIRYRAHMKHSPHLIEKTKQIGHKFVTFDEFFDKEAAAIQEAKTILDYKRRGWSILNRNKAGALGGNVRKWDRDSIVREAARFSTIRDFNNSNPSAYNAARTLGLIKNIKSHMRQLVRPKGFWTEQRIAREARNYATRKLFQSGSSSAYAIAGRLGIKDKVCAHMRSGSEGPRKWPEAEIAKEAQKYKSRSEFQRKASGAHKAAVRLGILDSIYKHMASIIHPNGYWTPERISAEAKKYSQRSQFKTAAGSAYHAARRLGIMERVCRHMGRSRRGR